MARNKLSQTYLISEELLKLYSNITRNVGVDKVYPFIGLAQPFYITPIIGDDLEEELTQQIESDSLTEENKSLIIKIAMPLALWTEYLAIRSLSYTVTQKGITKEHSENSESLSEAEVGEYMLDIKNKAEQASELLIRYLCRCRDLYPKWIPQEDCNCNKYYPSEGSAEKPFKPLIYFPNGRSGCNKC